jgi:hypothetical protein
MEEHYRIIKPEEQTSDVWQTVAFKVCMDLAVDINELTPAELMDKYEARDIRVATLRRSFSPPPPYINGGTTNAVLAQRCAAMIKGALDNVRGDR